MCVPSQESQPSDGSGFLCFRMNRAGGFFKNPIQKKKGRKGILCTRSLGINVKVHPVQKTSIRAVFHVR